MTKYQTNRLHYFLSYSLYVVIWVSGDVERWTLTRENGTLPTTKPTNSENREMGPWLSPLPAHPLCPPRSGSRTPEVLARNRHMLSCSITASGPSSQSGSPMTISLSLNDDTVLLSVTDDTLCTHEHDKQAPLALSAVSNVISNVNTIHMVTPSHNCPWNKGPGVVNSEPVRSIEPDDIHHVHVRL